MKEKNVDRHHDHDKSNEKKEIETGEDNRTICFLGCLCLCIWIKECDSICFI